MKEIKRNHCMSYLRRYVGSITISRRCSLVTISLLVSGLEAWRLSASTLGGESSAAHGEVSISVRTSQGSGVNERCTPVPSLYANWKRDSLGPNATDDQIKAHADSWRDKVKYDPFDAIINLKTRQESDRVLWEDDDTLVLVPKSPTLPKALVIPKSEAMFPIDVPPTMLDRLASVAATTYDAFIEAAGSECKGTVATIYINPPQRISVKHLHIHVEPAGSAQSAEEQSKVYAVVTERLQKLLSSSGVKN